MSSQDLFVLLKGDVPTHHVIQQHTEGPHGGRATVVAAESDPLRRTVHPRTWREEEGGIRYFIGSTVYYIRTELPKRYSILELWWMEITSISRK